MDFNMSTERMGVSGPMITRPRQRGGPYYHPAGGTKVANDPGLRVFLEASRDDEALRALDDLLNGEAGTMVRDTVTRQLARSRWMANHIDDVLEEVRAKLSQQLWSLRSGAGEPIEDFRAYCAVASERTCYAFLRRQFPERTRLRNRLRYAATRHPSMALETDSHGVWRCRSTGIRLAAEPGSTRALIDAPVKYAADHGIDREAPFPALVATLLDGCDEPIEFDRLVDAVATLLGVPDAPGASRHARPARRSGRRSAKRGGAPGDFDHPDFDHLAALVDGKLEDAYREWITSHLETCEVCREDVEDLTQVRASLLAHPATPVATNPVPGADTPEARWLKRAIGFAAIAAAVPLAVWIGKTRLPVIEPAPAPSIALSTPQSSPPAPAPRAVVPVLTEEEDARVKRALATGRLELPPNMAVLRGYEGTLPAADNSQAPLLPSTPVATAIVEARPQFVWTPMAGTTRYAVTIFDERFRQITKSGSLKATSWTPPRDLPRGRVLQWQITAFMKDGTRILSPVPPHPEARFMVLTTATVTAIAKERTRLATQPVALGLVLAKAGLFAEAERVLESALADDRYNRGEVRALLARLRAR
jgi:hypothetical protein